jgi:predicted RecA/RadA family phage recombinase
MAVAVFVQEGFSRDYTPTSDVAAGDVIDLGVWVGIAVHDIPANTLGALQLEGIYDVAKFAGEAIADGATIYWDQGTLTATGTIAYSEAVMGRCVQAALAGDATVRVKLMPALG